MISSNRQHTLAADLQFEGIGLHTGKHAQLRILPGEANTGYVFVRKDLEGEPSIEAHVSNVERHAAEPLCKLERSLCTRPNMC